MSGPTRSRPRRFARVGALIAVFAVAASLTLSGCGDSEPVVAPTPTPPPTATPAPTPPAKGCYRLTYAEAVSPSTASTPSGAVKCAKKHTSETFYVGRLSTTVEGHLAAVDSAKVSRQGARICPAKLAAYVGGNRDDLRLSMLRAVWFTPTVEESDLGASWLRCDVIVVGGPDTLTTVTGSLKKRLDNDAESVAICGTASPSSSTFSRVPCSTKHSWRALEVVEIGGSAYPGSAKAKAAGQTQCRDAGRDVAANALDYSWSYEWPTAAQWKAGQTYGLCWAPTS